MNEKEESPAGEAASFFVEGIECIACIVTLVIGGAAFFFGVLNPILLPIVLVVVFILIICCVIMSVVIYKQRKAELQMKEETAEKIKQVPTNCPVCNAPLKGHENFCRECGAALESD